MVRCGVVWCGAVLCINHHSIHCIVLCIFVCIKVKLYCCIGTIAI